MTLPLEVAFPGKSKKYKTRGHFTAGFVSRKRGENEKDEEVFTYIVPGIYE